MKLVTFIIPCAPYHRERVRRAVASVLAQTIPCDFRVVHDIEKRGPGWARNAALDMVTTPFVAFLDADDELDPAFAEKTIAAWKPGHYVWTHWREDDGRVRPVEGERSAVLHLVTCLMSTEMAQLVRFDEHTEAEDTDFYLNLLSRGVRRVMVPEPLLTYHNGNGRGKALLTSGKLYETIAGLAAKYRVNIELPPLPKAKSVRELIEWWEGRPLQFDAAGQVLPLVSRDWRPPQPLPPSNKAKPPLPDAVDISIVVPTHNRIAYLQNMICSARAAMPAGLTYEFVVVDGGSTDGTLEWCHCEPGVRVIEHGGLRGTVKAFTDGAEAARGTYVAVVNDDTEFVAGSIQAAYDWLEHRPECGCVAFAYMLQGDGAYHPDHFVVGEHTYVLPNRQIMRLNFANMGMYRKALGDAMGWFGRDDAQFNARSYGSDSYASTRVWEMGYRVDMVPGAIVYDRNAVDGLKQINQFPPDLRNPDTQAFYKRFPYGPQIPLDRVNV